MFKKVAGVKDILPDEAVWWQRTEEICRNIFSLYNYKEIRLPLIEEERLFNRSLGESAEIIQKQMFLIKREKDVYALRPEGTASIVRAYLENNLDKTSGFIKLYYMGPMFRAERPQKARLRQFHHIGCEALGAQDAFLDVEVIALADNLLHALAIRDYQLQLNSIGCPEDKKKLAQTLHKALKERIRKLCPDCQRRLKTNILRALDCKNEHCRKLVSELGIGHDHLCADCLEHFTAVKEGLDSLKINYTVSPCLVRGLDYYTRTVFEITHQALGAQDAIGAGGRYDNLVQNLGGPSCGAIGFAFGIERLLLAAGSLGQQVTGQKLVYLITLGDAARKQGLGLLDSLRHEGIAADTDYEHKSLKAAMRRANDYGAKSVLILGEDELKKNVITLKDMGSGGQEEVNREDLVARLKTNKN
jgi:histidyl-tRNA synthetase